MDWRIERANDRDATDGQKAGRRSEKMGDGLMSMQPRTAPNGWTHRCMDGWMYVCKVLFALSVQGARQQRLLFTLGISEKGRAKVEADVKSAPLLGVHERKPLAFRRDSCLLHLPTYLPTGRPAALPPARSSAYSLASPHAPSLARLRLSGAVPLPLAV